MALVSFYSFAQLSCYQDFDLYNWEQSLTSNNNWVVKSSTSATEVKTGGPTFLLSPTDIINVEITGQFRRGDTDIMGFAIGFDKAYNDTTSKYNSLLIDWKPLSAGIKGPYIATEGLKLNNLNNTPLDGKYFWGHYNDQYFETIASAGNGSVNQNSWNDIRLIYTSTQVTCIINNDTIFNESGCYKAGRFGFYDYSMVNSKFRNFKYRYKADIDLESETICANTALNFNFSQTKDCYGNVISSAYTPQSVFWDFGDGYNSHNLNPTHIYSTAGTKTINVQFTSPNGCVENISKQITVLPSMIPNFVADDVCLGDSVSFNNLSSVYDQILWKINDSIYLNDHNPKYLFNQAGYHDIKLIISDSLEQCIDSIQKKVEVIDLDVNLGPDTSICGNSFFLQAQSSNADLLWLNDSSTASGFQVTHSSNIILQASFGNCSTKDSIYIDLEPFPSVGFIIDQACEGQSTVFIDTSSGINLNRKWYINGTQALTSNQTIQKLFTTSGPKEVKLVVENNLGCSDSVTKVFNVQPKIQLNLPSSIQVCDTQYQVNLSLPQGYNISWNNGSQNANTTFTQSGFYSVTVTNNNCITKDSFQLKLKAKPEAKIQAHDVCEGETLQLLNNSSGSIFYNNWNFGNGSNSTNLNPSITYNQAGNYQIRLIVTSTNNCKDTTYQNINVDPKPLLNLGSDTSVCGGPISLNSNITNATYLWSTNETAPNIVVNTSGNYQLQVDSGACTVTDNIEVNILEKPAANFTLDGLCTNDTLVFLSNSSPNAQNIEWLIDNQNYSGDSLNLQIETERNLNIKLVAYASNGCTDTFSSSVYIHSPNESTLTTSGDEVIYPGEQVNIAAYGGQSTYEWTPKNNLGSPYSNETSASPDTSQYYYIKTKDENGCIITDSVHIEVKEIPKLYIPDAFTPNGDNNNDMFYLSGEDVCEINFNIYNRWGNQIFEGNNLEDKWDGLYKGKTQDSEGFLLVGSVTFCSGNQESFKKKIHLLR